MAAYSPHSKWFIFLADFALPGGVGITALPTMGGTPIRQHKSILGASNSVGFPLAQLMMLACL